MPNDCLHVPRARIRTLFVNSDGARELLDGRAVVLHRQELDMFMGLACPAQVTACAFGQLYPHSVATSRTVVESEEPPPSLLRCDEEQIYLHEVRGKKGRRLRLKLCVHDQSTVGADASTHKHTRSLFVTSKKWCGTTEYLLNYARLSIETRLGQRARGGHAPKSRTRGPRTRP